MSEPKLLDVVELLVDLPEQKISAGNQGAIVDVYPDEHYEVEFTNADGETLALVTLPRDRFIVVWQSETQN